MGLGVLQCKHGGGCMSPPPQGIGGFWSSSLMTQHLSPSLLGQTLYCMSSGRGLPPTKAKGARESLKERKAITSLLAFSS